MPTSQHAISRDRLVPLISQATSNRLSTELKVEATKAYAIRRAIKIHACQATLKSLEKWYSRRTSECVWSLRFTLITDCCSVSAQHKETFSTHSISQCTKSCMVEGHFESDKIYFSSTREKIFIRDEIDMKVVSLNKRFRFQSVTFSIY